MKYTDHHMLCKKAKKAPETAQVPLFPADPTDAPSPRRMEGRVEFLCPSPETMFIGDARLRAYLEHNGLSWIIRLREQIEASDLTAFTSAYDPMGRKPIHPTVMLGLTVYGILNRHASLRDLESLAILDLGAWWLTGGLQPDHSTIGNFLTRHAALLSERYFVDLTRRLVGSLKLKAGETAGDGTVIEAAASRFRTLTAEAAAEAARETRERSGEDSEETRMANKTATTAQERAKSARAHGRSSDTVRVSPTEPEAALQPRKDGARRFSYKPSVLATQDGLIVGQDIHATDENAVVETLLDQHQEIFDAAPTRTMWDAGYCNGKALKAFADRELDALCPSGTADRGEWEKKTKSKVLPKSEFRYDEETDSYQCPAGHRLVPVGSSATDTGQRFVRYGDGPCGECPLRERCTTSDDGRKIKRYEGEEYKEAMRQVMSQPSARQHYRKRKAIVEPVFAQLRERLGLTRFRRRGLSGVRLEFSLYCVAYNLKRAMALEAALLGVFGLATALRKALRTAQEARESVVVEIRVFFPRGLPIGAAAPVLNRFLEAA